MLKYVPHFLTFKCILSFLFSFYPSIYLDSGGKKKKTVWSERPCILIVHQHQELLIKFV